MFYLDYITIIIEVLHRTRSGRNFATVRASMTAVGGVLLGYSAHAILSAFGIAAIVASSSFLFYALKWSGVVYLGYLSVLILISAARRKGGILPAEHSREKHTLWRGFFTSFLNPKGLLVYLAILPQFISKDANTAVQALGLSALFIAGCSIVYSIVGLSIATVHGRSISDKARRCIEAFAGSLLIFAAVKLALQVK